MCVCVYTCLDSLIDKSTSFFKGTELRNMLKDVYILNTALSLQRRFVMIKKHVFTLFLNEMFNPLRQRTMSTHQNMH